MSATRGHVAQAALASAIAVAAVILSASGQTIISTLALFLSGILFVRVVNSARARHRDLQLQRARARCVHNLQPLLGDRWVVKSDTAWTGNTPIDVIAKSPAGVAFAIVVCRQEGNPTAAIISQHQAAWVGLRRGISHGGYPVLCIDGPTALSMIVLGVLVVSQDMLVSALRANERRVANPHKRRPDAPTMIALPAAGQTHVA